MQTINPAPHQLFLMPSEAVSTTKSGFYLSETAAERPQTAEVINVGSAVKEYKPKDTVVYKSYASTEIKLNNENYLLIQDDDILGVVVETDE